MGLLLLLFYMLLPPMLEQRRGKATQRALSSLDGVTADALKKRKYT